MEEQFKVITYERVSTEDQVHTMSCPDQKTTNDRHALQHNWKLADNEDYRDEGISGKITERPGLQDLIIRCKEDPSIKAVVVTEADRIARGNQAFIFVREVLKKLGVKIIAVTQPMIDDSDEGEMIGEIFGAVNGYLASITRRKSMRALDEKAARGVWPSKAPTGYRNVNWGTEERPDRGIDVNESEAIFVKQIPDLYKSGKSYQQIADYFDSLGFKGRDHGRISANEVRQILFNDFYLGEFDWRGKRYKGTHFPLFKKLDVIMARNRSMEIGHVHSGGKLKDEFHFKRLNFRCADCECRITAEKKRKYYQRTQREAIYFLYHCTKSKGGWKGCKQPSINKNDLIEQFATKAVAPISIDRELAEFLLEEIDNQSASMAEDREKLLESINRRLVQLDNEARKLFEVYVAGRIMSLRERSSDQVYEEFRFKNESERDKLSARKRNILDQSNDWKEKASNFFSLCIDAENRFLNAPEEKQAEFLKVITSNVLLNQKQLIVTHQFPFSVLLKSPEHTSLLRPQVSIRTEQYLRNFLFSSHEGEDYFINKVMS